MRMSVKDAEKLNNTLKIWPILNAMSFMVFHRVHCSKSVLTNSSPAWILILMFHIQVLWFFLLPFFIIKKKFLINFLRSVLYLFCSCIRVIVSLYVPVSSDGEDSPFYPVDGTNNIQPLDIQVYILKKKYIYI